MTIDWGPQPGSDEEATLPRAGALKRCPNCRHPEIDVFGKSAVSQITWLMCRACGHVWQSAH
jgi:hypothetical protein